LALRAGAAPGMMRIEWRPVMRKFMVVLDNSTECLNAMRFAAMRAQNTGARVEILR